MWRSNTKLIHLTQLVASFYFDMFYAPWYWHYTTYSVLITAHVDNLKGLLICLDIAVTTYLLIISLHWKSGSGENHVSLYLMVKIIWLFIYCQLSPYSRVSFHLSEKGVSKSRAELTVWFVNSQRRSGIRVGIPLEVEVGKLMSRELNVHFSDMIW